MDEPNEPPKPQLQMIWPVERLDSPPEVSLSAGYTLRTYRDEDRRAYLEMMSLAGFEGWTSEYLAKSREADLPEGLLVVEHEASGALVATSRAQDKPREAHPEGGEVAWVAASPDHRGRGLGAAVTAAATVRLLDAGYRNIYLLTDDWRSAAITTYLRVGYVPMVPDEPTADRWREVCRGLDWPFTPERWPRGHRS